MLSIFSEKEIKQIQLYVCMVKQEHEHKLDNKKKEKDGWLKAHLHEEYYEYIKFLEEEVEILSNISNKISRYMNDNHIY